MRSTRVVGLAGLVVILFAGCYHPDLGSPSFFCHEDDHPACPDGQLCIDGRCAYRASPDSEAAPPDLAVDMAMLQSPPDLSYHHSSKDFSGSSSKDFSGSSTHDLTAAQLPDGASCVPTGGDCTYHNDSICCSKYCIYASETCQ